MKKEKKIKPPYKKWWKYLVGLLGWVLIAAIILFAGLGADSAMPDGSGGDMTGHKAPVFTLLAFFLIGVVMLFAIIRAIVKIIKSIKYYKQIDNNTETFTDLR